MSQKSEIISFFKLNGLSLRSDGAKYLCTLLAPIPEEDHDDILEKVVAAVQKLPLASALIGQKDIALAAKDVAETESDEPGNLLQIINKNTIPKLEFNIEKNKFVIKSDRANLFHGTPDEKTQVFRNRYFTVFHRAKQHKLFKAPPAGTPASRANNFGLTKVEYLIGGGSSATDVVVLGLLTNLMEGKMHLEDDTGAVPVNMKEATFHKGLFPQNCLVLIEGSYEDGELTAKAIGLPPFEEADTTRALLGNVNYFGGNGSTCAKYNKKLQLAYRRKDTMFVILSDVWLDKLQVVKKLEVLFRGYDNCPPAAFILCGNFLSACHTSQQIEDLKTAFSSLGDMLSNFHNLLTHSKFIFVPGPSDPGLTGVYPRSPLPAQITSALKSKIPNCEFVGNPCRLLYCTQEIVVFREDIMTKICRNSIHFPEDHSDIPSHFAHTLASQAHLCPLPLHVLPVYWPLDHCLSLHPTPDLVITADRADPFTTSANGATFCNPGSFLKTDFSFKVFYPKQNLVEDSQITEDME